MPSSKDILEAQRFNRNRLITAFTSGTPDGREVDTPSPVRPLIFGSRGRVPAISGQTASSIPSRT